ncbi:MAG: hypothetical protein K5838_01990 [Elusimicrobiales bacterium]|nr:hypothetical protein [Elusimicrobiales bacterium]
MKKLTINVKSALMPLLAAKLRNEACKMELSACCISLNDRSLKAFLPEILKVPLYFMQDKNNPDKSLWKILPSDLNIDVFVVRPDGDILECDFIDTKTEDISELFYRGLKNNITETQMISIAIRELNSRISALHERKKEIFNNCKIFLFTDNIGLASFYSQKINVPQEHIIIPVLCETAESFDNIKLSGTFLGTMPPIIIDSPKKMPMLIKAIRAIHSFFIPQAKGKHETLFKENDGQILTILEQIAYGAEGEIFNTCEKDKVAKILFMPDNSKGRIIHELCGIKTRIPGLCLPETALINSSRKTLGYLMPKADGFLLKDLLFRPERCGIDRNEDIPRIKIIQSILKKIIAINNAGFFLSDLNSSNFVIKLEPDFETFFIDTDNFSRENEEQQNRELADIIFEILASGFKLKQRNTKIGIYFWHKILKPKLREKFEQHLCGRKIKPAEWLETIDQC